MHLNNTTTFAALLACTACLLAAAPAQDAKSLKGAIKIDGSSTVYPITEAVAEEFNKTASKVRVTVGISGTGGGFKRFCAGEIDIADASRPIKKTESDTAGKNKVEYVELPVAYDGLTIVVNPKNTWCNALTLAQVTKLYSASGGVKTWKDLDPSWPANPIKVYSPGTDSGTFDYFKEVTVGKDGSIRSDMSVSEDDNVLVRGVSGDENAIGFFGCAYYFENKDKVRSIAIDGGKGPVKPTTDTIENGSYAPFSRPLFIYVNKTAAARPEVAAFIEFYLKNAPELVSEVGYVKLPEPIQSKVVANWTARRTGTQFMTPAGEPVTGSLATVYE
ncbi:MAG: PstS family phosphate ABC transporter substrate-binding protein [Planctomycetota bacterium]